MQDCKMRDFALQNGDKWIVTGFLFDEVKTV